MSLMWTKITPWAAISSLMSQSVGAIWFSHLVCFPPFGFDEIASRLIGIGVMEPRVVVAEVVLAGVVGDIDQDDVDRGLVLGEDRDHGLAVVALDDEVARIFIRGSLASPTGTNTRGVGTAARKPLRPVHDRKTPSSGAPAEVSSAATVGLSAARPDPSDVITEG